MTEVAFTSTPSAKLVKQSASDDDVAMAAWVSFNAADESRLENRDRVEGLINFLMREEHNSPFEHSTFTFLIDCPVFVAREFHRHRTMAYNEVSGRYTEMEPRFYVPAKDRPLIQRGKPGKYFFVRGDKGLSDIVRASIRGASHVSMAAYRKMLNIGVAKEVSRMVLPVNMMTQFYATVNARNLIHFLELRTSPQALYEIRMVAGDMEKALQETMPLTYAAWKAKQEEWNRYQSWKNTVVSNEEIKETLK